MASFHFTSLQLLLVMIHTLIERATQSNPDGAMLTRFRNLTPYDVCLWWLTPYDDEAIRFFGHLTRNGGMTSFTSYVGHRFFWAPPDKQYETSARRGFFQITKDKILYVYEDKQQPGDANVIQTAYGELQFLDNYYKTYNRHWLSTYQRPAPVLPFIVMTAQDSTTKWVTSDSYHWTCADTGGTSRVKRMVSVSKCQDRNNAKPLKFMVEQLYKKDPRIYKISNFINEFEANHIIQISEQYMHRSTVGDGRNQRQDPTRTCSNTWLSMNHTKVVETIYHRIGDVLGINKYKMNVKSTINDKNGELEGVASHMEVIRFGTNEHYSRHYDNAVNDQIYLHFITFQVILRTSDDFRGGQTGFPHAGSVDRDDRRNSGYRVESEQYSAVFWFNLLPDGNLDETSMYSNTRVSAGEQWMFHVSVWDPTLPKHGDPKMPHDVMYAMHDEL
eukprot:100429_1